MSATAETIRPRRAPLGLIGFLVGALALIVSIMETTGALAPPPPPAITLGEAVDSLGSRAIDAARETARETLDRFGRGEAEEIEPATLPDPAPAPAPAFSVSDLVKSAVFVLAGLAILAGAIGLYRHEPRLLPGLAIGAGASAVLFQFFVWLAILILVVVVVVSFMGMIGDVFS